MVSPSGVHTTGKSLDSLRTALALTDGAAVSFALAPSGEERDQWKERLRRVLEGRLIVESRLSPEEPLDLERLQERLDGLQKQGDCPVLFVEADGLDRADLEVSIRGALAERVERTRRMLQHLNLKREALAGLDVPIAFWIIPAALRAFSVWAADLFSANSGVFDFEFPYIEARAAKEQVRASLAIERLHEASSAEERALWNLPEAEVRGRIRLYEDQLEREGRKHAPHRPRLAGLRMELAHLYRRLGDLPHALERQQKAVELYRELAERNRDAFLPDLASSLNNLGNRLSELGRREEALAAYEEAVRALAPFFLRLPAAFAEWMGTMARNYVEACEALGQEPDEVLLGPVVEALQEMEEGQGEPPADEKPPCNGRRIPLGLNPSEGCPRDPLRLKDQAHSTQRSRHAYSHQDHASGVPGPV